MVHEMVERRARAAPDAVAVSYRRHSLTYRDLNDRANQLAHHLRGRGVGPESLVPVCVERGLEMVVAVLGILKSGGAYVPLDPDYPDERLAFVLRDTDAKVVVSQERFRHRLPTAAVCLDADLVDIEREPRSDLVSTASPTDLAYVIYTSGSTGTPKGVLIQHDSMVSRMRAMVGQYALTSADRCLQFSSIAFDGAVGQVFPPLMAGAELVVRGNDWSPSSLLDLIRARELTVCELPPAVWNELIPRIGPDGLGDHLRLVSLGGEQVLPASVTRWFDHTHVPLLNVYGPAETTVTSTTQLITAPMDPVPIGCPVADTDVVVVDGDRRPVADGTAGELWIGGVGVARGYLNRPDLTADRFVDADLTGVRHRWYRTGDLVRRLPGGALEFLGRVDYQLALHGHRIEPGEIESRVVAHDGVTSCVVVVREDRVGDGRLVAYYTTRHAVDLSARRLRQWCAQMLPVFMVPTSFVRMDELPRTFNGKVDRAALPAPDPRTRTESAFVAPRTPVEHTLCLIWSEVLDVDRVGVLDNFFDLGGESFLSVRMISKAREQGIRLTPRMIFQHPTVSDLAKHVSPRAEPAPVASRFRVLGGVEDGRDRRVSMVELNDGPPARTIFCLHEVGGNVSGYLHLARALSSTARMLGVESRTVGFGMEPEVDIAAMAATYWDAIRSVQPRGPYLLAGYSFGGVLGLEIARLASEAREQVDLLIALDSGLPVNGAKEATARDLVMARRLRELAAVPDTALSTSADVAALMDALDLPADLLSLPRAEFLDLLGTRIGHLTAVLAYVPRRTDCPVLLFQAEMSTWTVAPARGWRAFATNLTTETVSGNHHTMLKPPHVAAIAEGIEQALLSIAVR